MASYGPELGADAPIDRGAGRDGAAWPRLLPSRRDLAAFAGLAAAYWFFASYGLTWANLLGAGSPIWPAAGVAIAGLALGGVRLWPAIFLGRVLAAVTIGSSNPAWVVVGIAAGNALAAALPVWLMLRAGRVDARLATLSDVLWVVGASALSALLAASAGTGALALGGVLPPQGAATTWTDWIYGNFAGAVVVAPLVLAWFANGREELRGRSLVHLALVLGFVAALGWLVFLSDVRPGQWQTWHIFPALVWAALAFQVRGAALALLVVAAVAVWGASAGVGPFVALDLRTGEAAEVLIQQFVGLTGSTVLLLAAAADERRAKHALRATAAELGRQKLELETLYREAPVGLALIDADGRLLRVNDAMAAIGGFRPEAALGRRLREVAPGLAEPLDRLRARVVATGEPILGAAFGYVAPDRPRHVDVSLYPVASEGAVQAVSCVGQDVTERKEAESRERLLAKEVDHRAKNLLAVIQGVVQLTRADDIEGFAAAVTGRIQALGRAHSLLAASRWEGVDLMQLVAEEMAPFADRDDRRVRVEGTPIQLRPAAAQSLALVLHELATNAAKYGSLSDADGWVEIAWTMTGSDGRKLRFRWTERSGPPVEPPTRRGFGSSLIRSSVERQLKGRVAIDWRREGMVCELVLPAEQLAATDGEAQPADVGAPDAVAAGRSVAGCRVLVVEDEALVAMQIEGALAAAGCTVVGPAARVSDGLDLAGRGAIDAALLDIDVAGERSFPVAERLAERGVPFAFCTGYEDAELIPERFRDAPVLPKPFAAPQILAAVERLASARRGSSA